ncbi:glycosyl hydrolase [Piedraia hortae CBS 480.64]|uniref:Vacuolar protein sorting/targeting protein 10 n=1 Tax=Piedraia hortae CBS 480.64 TaxID=1314780 RepID=A0A6A7BS70_9PEZI|nr:glycosyl hydrolase [Piedraia hortae CBS 480.64]
MRLVWMILALVGLALAKDQPEVKESSFDGPVGDLFYFEDSDVVLLTSARTAYRSEDAGATWKPLDGPNKGETIDVVQHPHLDNVAIVLGSHKTHWITKDKGKTWTAFDSVSLPPTMSRPAISFHATDPDRIIFHSADCVGWLCDEKIMYTTDGFKTAKPLRDKAVSCLWAKSTNVFTTGSEHRDKNQILCIVKGSRSPFSASYRLLASDDFFETEAEPTLHSDGRPVGGVTQLAAVKGYIAAAAKSERTSELAMYVTVDAVHWHRAEFGEHTLEEDGYTLLESTNYSMQVDVLSGRRTAAMGALMTSNYNGTFFTKNIEHTNRNMRGYVDFEKIQNIQGIVMVNVVDNPEEVEKNWQAVKKLKTKISFDDGRTWHAMGGDDGPLHLHSVTNQVNLGRMFSSPAPGIIMGVGNRGKHLTPYEEGDLHVSDDAGWSWRKALSGPHLYEFGDQGAVLVAIKHGETDAIHWSLNHGKDWEKADLGHLGVRGKITPIILTTTPDSTSLKFTMVATRGKGTKLEHLVVSLDFAGLHEDKCKSKDFEDWYARVDDKGNPTCIMGHTQRYRRRKADKKCFVDEEFKDPKPEQKDCKCTAQDYECDFENNFVWDPDGKKCVSNGPIKAPKDKCKNPDDTFMGSSGYRLIPGNTCIKKGGEVLDEPVERKCGEAGKAPASGKITAEVTEFKGGRFVEYYYLERGESSSGDDETVVMRTDLREAWITHDHGKTWSRMDTDGKEVVAIYPHQYIKDVVYLITPGKKVYFSQNRGKTMHSFEAPEKPNHDRLQILQFHPTQKDWLIWTGGRDQQTVAHVSTKGGDDWRTLLKSVRKCQFVYREDRRDSDRLIYCEQYEDENPHAQLRLLSSSDFFEHKKELQKNIVSFATMAEYIVVAKRNTELHSLEVDTSIDGQIFANAQFPKNFHVPQQQAYTVLDSSTHAVFMHVTVNSVEDSEYGSIVKSNSNGTNYVLSVDEVSRNRLGYVDFEKMQGLEGVAVVNRVANAKDADKGHAKKLQTFMTHNDGADWARIPMEKWERDGKEERCDGGIEKCSLHLHGYTERRDPGDTFSSPSAVGLMLATGNVGEFLKTKKEADTWLTADGGVTWKLVAPGNWMWEFGDQGSILVIVKEDEPTREILYSLDEGSNWKRYTFSDALMTVEDLTTVPSDTSRNFLLWGKMKGNLVSVNIDFSGLEERRHSCHLDERNPEGPQSDYYLWSPKHPQSDNDCLFGHVAQYHRKKTDASCYNGRELQHLHNIARNCTCTRMDFECDYNYERVSDGSCRLIPGEKPLDPETVCRENPNLDEYYDITGYRRIPLTTCEGGFALDHTSTVRPCPGHEEGFKKKHGISAWGVFLAIFLPIVAATGVGYWAYNHWDGKFGRIRLGEESSLPTFMSRDTLLDRDAPWIKYPVIVISAVMALVSAVPAMVATLARRLAPQRDSSFPRFTNRSQFASSFGRGSYEVVDDLENEGESD